MYSAHRTDLKFNKPQLEVLSLRTLETVGTLAADIARLGSSPLEGKFLVCSSGRVEMLEGIIQLPLFDAETAV